MTDSRDPFNDALAANLSADEFAEVDRYLLTGTGRGEEDARLGGLRAEFVAGRQLKAPEVTTSWSHLSARVEGIDRLEVPGRAFSRGLGRYSLRGETGTALHLGRKTTDAQERGDSPPFREARLRRGMLAVVCAVALLAIVRSPHAGRFQRSGTASIHRYATLAGQQATVPLRDGVQALLGPATHLTVGPTGTVAVNGQALFVVRSQHTAPFVVRVGNAEARVLGTSFLVRRYTADAVVRVVVLDGRVALRGAQTVVLSARMLGVVNDSGNVIVTPSIAVEDYTAWTTGQLVFRQTPITEIVADLGRVYNAEIHVTDPQLLARKLTWTIPVAHRSLQAVLNVLATTLNAHFERNGHVITIVPGRAAVVRPVAPHHSSSGEATYGR